MIPVDIPWVAIAGDTMGIESIGINVVRRQPTVAVSRLDSAADVPDSAIGLSGLDLMIIGAGSNDWIGDLNPQQQAAISDWVHGGGKLFVMLGQRAPELLRFAPFLKSMLPPGLDETLELDASGLEIFTSSQTRLEPFTGIRLPRDQGEVLILGRTTRRIGAVIAARYPAGFGSVTALAADMDSGAFADWPQRLDLIHSLTDQVLIDVPGDKLSSGQTAYDDLAGQLRWAMDRFESSRRIQFALIALVLLTLVAVVGPLDYYLVNRIFGRPMLGWLTFPIVAIGLSAALWWTAGGAETIAFQNRRLECVDLDLVFRSWMSATTDSASSDPATIDNAFAVGRGTAIDYFYTHQAGRFDVTVQPTAVLRDLTVRSANSQSSQNASTTVAPNPSTTLAPGHWNLSSLGHPGSTFGGIDLTIEDDRLPMYEVQTTTRSATDATTINQLPLPPRSSKGLISQWSFRPSLTDLEPIRRRPGSELLQGGLTNPLPVDLLDGRLIYRNWVYILPTRLPAGGRIGDLDLVRQKNFRWLLSKQRAIESSSETELWDPQNPSLDRIIEMMLYYDAAGGRDYTLMHHRALGFLDISDSLTEGSLHLGRTGRTATDTANVSVRWRDGSGRTRGN